MENLKSYKISIKGIVQGVGFRPFIWRVCKNMDLKGFVTNTTDGVYMEINSSGDKDILKLIETIHRDKPPQSLIESVEYRQLPFKHYSNFSIERSIEGKEKFQLISPDIATCKSCLEDINDVNNKRRHGYPFTNCTNCGPRFTIIDKMPYDRVNTTMHNFLMCQDCQKEYDNPSNRRFHAQPNACTNCGPRILIMDKSGRVLNKKDAISFAVKKLNEGKIIAVKSLGGFQIACNATSDKAVLLLRKRKMRPFKPFAVMFKDLKEIEKYLQTDSMEKASLLSPAAPIVLLKKKHRNEALDSIQQIKPAKNHGSKNNDLSLSQFISFNNKYEGAILPYTPLHHLIFNKIQIPLIMTSGNISEEPIASNNPEALEKLKGICDFFLVHDRDIS